MRITDVKYVKDYQLKLVFGDGSVKIVDLEPLLKESHGIFIPLRKIDYFKKVALDDCGLSICWPNGADICPDVLYGMGKAVATRAGSKPAKLRRVAGRKHATPS